MSGGRLLACTAVLAALSETLPAQQITFRAGVETVAVYATVRDRDHRLVTGLTKDAFEVFDGGKRTAITVFSSEPQPLSVAIMLDMSGSMSGTFDALRRSVLAFVNALRPEDRARIGTFGTEIAIGANLTNDRGELLRVLKEEIWAGGDSPGWQAISEAMASLAGESGRHVVLTLTDGEFTARGLAAWVNDRKTIEAQAARQDAAIYAIGFEGYKLSRDIVAAADNTGGSHFEVPGNSNLAAMFAKVAEELRHQYLIGFSPAQSDGRPHTVEVKMSDGRLKVQARRSYVGGARSMTRLTAIVTAAIVSAAVEIAGGAGPVRTQSNPATPLVTAHVVVTVAESGAPVSNLTAEDFDVWSDGTPVPLWHLSSEPEDLSVLLLIDASVSAIESWDISTDSLTTFIPPIDNGLIANFSPRDWLGLGVFGRHVHFGREFGRDTASLAGIEREVLRMDERDRVGPSPIWDAVDAATDLLAARPGQRVIILVTDGRATGNRKSLSAVVEHAMQADVAVTVIARGFFFMPPDVTANAPAVNLMLLANTTGGLFLAGGPQSALFARTLNQLHHTYVMTFAPPAEGAAHRLQVRVKKAGVQAHVRSRSLDSTNTVMTSDDNRLKIVAAGGVATALLVAAVYGLVRHMPLLNRPVLQPRATGSTGPPESGRATVMGVITGPAGAAEAARVTLVRVTDSLRPAPTGRGRGGGFGRGQSPLSTTTGPGGRFVLNDVPAGAFWIVAHAEVVGTAPSLPTHFWGIGDVSSDGQSTAEITLALAPGGTITGRLEFKSVAGTALPDVGGMTLILTAADPKTQAVLSSGPPHARPDDTGAFVIPAVAPGRYTLDVSAVPDWSLDSAVLDGQDRIDSPFDVPPGWGTRRATLIFSDRPNAVTGLVRHASGQPASFTLVMAFSAEPSLRQAPRRVQAVRTDATGRFTLSGLPTGGYLVAAAADVPPERWYTPGAFAELTPRAVPVSFGHGETKTIALQIR